MHEAWLAATRALQGSVPLGRSSGGRACGAACLKGEARSKRPDSTLPARKKYVYIYRERETRRDKERGGDRRKDGERERVRETKRRRDGYPETETETERVRGTAVQRDRETQRESKRE